MLYEVITVICFTLFRPGFWLDQIEPEFAFQPASAVNAYVDAAQEGDPLFLRFETQTSLGDIVEKTVRLHIGDGATVREKLAAEGLTLSSFGGEVSVTTVRLRSTAAKFGVQPGDRVIALAVPTERLPKQFFMLPALALLAGLMVLQSRRVITSYSIHYTKLYEVGTMPGTRSSLTARKPFCI